MISTCDQRTEDVQPSQTIEVTIGKRRVIAEDIISLELVARDGEELPAFTAGAHIEFEAAPGLVRQYSLCNSPAERHRYVLGIQRDPKSRGGSAYVHEKFHEGSRLTISSPRNHFGLAQDAEHHVLIAGGIGITPILCMARQLFARKASFELHFCARSASRAAFRVEIAESSLSQYASFYYDDAPDKKCLNIASLVQDPSPGRHLYVCGPAGLLDAVTNATSHARWCRENVHFEYFSKQVEQSGDSFDVVASRSGLTFRIGADQTIFQVLQDAGLDVPVSCEQGVCGTCLTRVLQGTPEHRDVFLTEEERAANDQMTICCSRAVSSLLVLDI